MTLVSQSRDSVVGQIAPNDQWPIATMERRPCPKITMGAKSLGWKDVKRLRIVATTATGMIYSLADDLTDDECQAKSATA